MTERGFTVPAAGRDVPGLLWTPAQPMEGSRPLVLMGHGATLNKRVQHLVALARILARRHGFAVAAIDGPGHGDRRSDGVTDEIRLFTDFVAEWTRPGSTDDVVEDWAATLAALRELDGVGDGPLGYWGLSMGTIYGIPFVASEPRVSAAVLGLMGLVGPTRDRLASDSTAIACPVLFLMQWDDQLMPREHVLELFEALGSGDKRLHAHPGEHAAVPEEELHQSVDFLVRHLAHRTRSG